MLRWLHRVVDCKPAEAVERLRRGNVPDRMHVRGSLDLAGSPWLTYLPRELSAGTLDISRCAHLRGLPECLTCDQLLMRRTNIQCLSAGLHVSRSIDAQDCRRLQHILPLRAAHLNLQGCTSLQSLPDGLVARRLILRGCTQLVEIPPGVAASVEHLDASNCTALTSLPTGLTRLASLSVQGCTNLISLPDDIRIRSWIEIAGSGLGALPWSLRSVRALWRGVQVSDRVAFDPESITVEEILYETNLTMRRVLLERVGIEWFLDHARAAVVDEDVDAGGPRRLLRIDFPQGENVFCVAVRCPSTQGRYVLRVPPRITTCAEAAAWLAGYADPAAYRPALET